ncbi:MAG TPA: transcriptional repressor LexA [Ktedonobacteraceae bacterium]|nr:transcriptional repressor LexA [Ktedonobacteraceae bacterium]
MAMKLSAARRKILQMIIDSIEENGGRSPTNREIGEAVITSGSSGHIAYHLQKLEEEGYIRHEKGKNRSIQVLKDCEGLPYQGQRQHQFGLPIHGDVAAGLPLTISQEPQYTVDLISPTHACDTFALRVQGNSMIDVGIYSGDYILVERGKRIENGDIVVATHRITGEATVKRFYLEKEQIRLKPENTTMNPIFVQANEWDNEWEIQGKLKAVIHLFA